MAVSNISISQEHLLFDAACKGQKDQVKQELLRYIGFTKNGQTIKQPIFPIPESGGHVLLFQLVADYAYNP